MTRQRPHDLASFTETQRRAYEAMRQTHHLGSDGYFHGPRDPWLLNGDLALAFEDLVPVLLHQLSLDRSLVELAVAIAGRFWESNLEWAGHSLAAVDAGIPQSVIDQILAGECPTGSAEQVLVYDICMGLCRDHELSDDLYRSAVDSFGEQGLMEIVAICGFYTMVCMTLNAFECKVAPGVPAPFKRSYA